MTAVTRLVTHVDLDDDAADDAGQMSVTARLEAVLADGRSVVLLDDRGWSWGWSSSAPTDAHPRISLEDVEADARTVVGPDEPYDGRTQEQMAADHWSFLAARLEKHGGDVEAHEWERLPHEVALTERLRARLRL
ncbi:hypothetical protein [Streptomyces sp. NPDC051079]|uniref:hypothetical protein n=1 Tax=Streptomyces sp. NPDC051079 TaxID=3155043 RepID=UPI00344C6DAC